MEYVRVCISYWSLCILRLVWFCMHRHMSIYSHWIPFWCTRQISDCFLLSPCRRVFPNPSSSSRIVSDDWFEKLHSLLPLRVFGTTNHMSMWLSYSSKLIPKGHKNKMKPTNPNAHTYDKEPRNQSYERRERKLKNVEWKVESVECGV